MATPKLGWAGITAISLAVLGSLVALGNVVVKYRDTGALDWRRVALAVGVPALIYAIVRGSVDRQGAERRKPD